MRVVPRHQVDGRASYRPEGHFAAMEQALLRLTDGRVLRPRVIGDFVTTSCVRNGVEKLSLEVGKRDANLSAYAMSHVLFTIG